MTARPRTALLAGIATALVLVGSALLAHGLRHTPEGTDLDIFFQYARSTIDGVVPYRDFRFEYPPGALLPIVLPGLGSSTVGVYATRFTLLMLVSFGLAALGCAGVLAACRASRERYARTLGLIALAPLLLGPITLKRFDAFPALLTVAALLLVVRRRPVPSAFVLGLATAVKIYPLVLLPVVVAAALQRSRRAAVESAASFLAGCAVLLLPALAVSPGGLEASVRSQFGRHLQIESTFASLLLAAHTVGGVSVGLISEAHSYALGGTSGNVLGTTTTLALIVGVLAVWWRAPRLVRSEDGLVLAFAATIAVAVAFGKVLSPQFLIWLIPLVPMVAGRLGWLVTSLFAAACVLTNLWFPARYGAAFGRLDGSAIMLLLARNTLLVAIAALLLAAVWRHPARQQP